MELQLVVEATTPPNVILLVPFVPPKLLPVIVTEVPKGPDPGDKPEITGLLSVKVAELLGLALTVTTTEIDPFDRPLGTVATMEVLLHVVIPAASVPNLRVLAPFVDPKFVPEIVTELPETPDVGDRLVIEGTGLLIVKLTELLAVPPTVTTTPADPFAMPDGTSAAIEVALQLET